MKFARWTASIQVAVKDSSPRPIQPDKSVPRRRRKDCSWLQSFSKGRIMRVAISLCVVLLVLCQPSLFGSDAPPFRNSDELEDGQWLMAPKDYANTRYSGLKEITAENVDQLQVAWTFSTGVNRGQEA